MTHPFNNISDQDKAEILKQASNIFPVPAHAIEKDWWVGLGYNAAARAAKNRRYFYGLLLCQQ